MNEKSLYGVEWTPQEKSSYAKAMKELRASYGLTDGLRTTPAGMNDYLSRRRAEDESARSGRRNPIHPSALAMYAGGSDPREGSGVVSAGGM